MTYRSQRIAYGYFAAALVLFALQVAFGFLSLAKYLGPDPLLDVMNFATSKAIHTNLLLVWLLTGFMGAAYYLVPEESRTRDLERARRLAPARALARDRRERRSSATCSGSRRAASSSRCRSPLKLGVVVVMLTFLCNIAHDDPAGAGASPPPRACWSAASPRRRCSTCRA